MRLLLDTHVMFWWLRDSPRLGERTKALIAMPKAHLMVSFASFWELSVKARIGKIPELGSKMMVEADAGGITILGLTARHLEVLESIEKRPDHKDPFDLLIVAQSIAEEATLVTRDAKMLTYGVPGFRIR